MEKKEICNAVKGRLLSGKFRKLVFFLAAFLCSINGISGEELQPPVAAGSSLTTFPVGDFWSLNAGIGMSDILVKGESFQFILDPKLWLSPKLMVGSKIGVNYSTDKILTFESQVYLRWNFLRFGSPEKTWNIFAQAGIGMLSAYRGYATPIDTVTRTRGSLLFDLAAGVTIPLSPRWHIEPSVRGGYPHIAGFSITVGYKFRLPEKTKYEQLPGKIEYVEIIKTIPQNEIIKRTMISMIEYILFGPDIGEYNAGIDHDAESLNELVLNEIAFILSENPDLLVRIEGHANPVTADQNEFDELLALSTKRANQVAERLRIKGVADNQMVVIAYGGTRTVTSDHDIWNRNRRVELIIIQLGTN